MKRNIYFLISLIWMLSLPLSILTLIKIGMEIGKDDDITWMVLLVCYLVIWIILTILSSVDWDSKLFTNFVAIFGTLKYKRIFHSELGEFYIRFKYDTIYVYSARYFILKHLYRVSYEGNKIPIDRIKSKIEEIYKDEYLRIKHLNDRKKLLNDWDGYLDTQGKRDDKINKIIK